MFGRPIRYRGWNRKNGVWLYGFYLQNRGAHFVCADEFADGKSWDDYEVDVNTVSEFTGRTDASGADVYEGDIVSVHYGARVVRATVCWNWQSVSFMFIVDGRVLPFDDSCVVLGNVWEL